MRSYRFQELNTAEQQEVIFRGWARGPHVRYVLKGDGNGAWALSHWTMA